MINSGLARRAIAGIRLGRDVQIDLPPGTRWVPVLFLVPVFVPGVKQVLSLPRGIELVNDALFVAAAGYLAWYLARGRGRMIVPFFGLVWCAVTLVGFATDAAAGSVLVSLRNYLLPPLFALLLANAGALSGASRRLCYALAAACCVQMGVTIAQAISGGAGQQPLDTDSVVGTLGPYANWAASTLLCVGALVGLGNYLARDRGGATQLALVVVLPLATLWMVVTSMLIVFPVAGTAVLVGAVIARRPGRRAFAGLAAVTAACAMLYGGYAVWHADSLDSLLSSESRSNYLQNATVTPEAPPELASNGSFENGPVGWELHGPLGAPAQSVTAITAARSSTGRARQGGVFGRFEVEGRVPGEGITFKAVQSFAGDAPYRATAWLRSRRPRRARLVLGVPDHHVVGPSVPVTRHWTRAAVTWRPRTGVAEAWLAVVSAGPPQRGAVDVDDVRLQTKPRPDVARPAAPASESTPAPVPSLPTETFLVAGRAAQYRQAYDLIDDTRAHLLFGRGLGTATFAENVGIVRRPDANDAAASSYADYAALLIERGVIGLGLALAGGLLLALVSLSSLRRAGADPWEQGLALAFPGVIVAFFAVAAYASPFRNDALSVLFWTITGLVLAPLLRSRGERSGHD